MPCGPCPGMPIIPPDGPSSARAWFVGWVIEITGRTCQVCTNLKSDTAWCSVGHWVLGASRCNVQQRVDDCMDKHSHDAAELVLKSVWWCTSAKRVVLKHCLAALQGSPMGCRAHRWAGLYSAVQWSCTVYLWAVQDVHHSRMKPPGGMFPGNIWPGPGPPPLPLPRPLPPPPCITAPALVCSCAFV